MLIQKRIIRYDEVAKQDVKVDLAKAAWEKDQTRKKKNSVCKSHRY